VPSAEDARCDAPTRVQAIHYDADTNVNALQETPWAQFCDLQKCGIKAGALSVGCYNPTNQENVAVAQSHLTKFDCPEGQVVEVIYAHWDSVSVQGIDAITCRRAPSASHLILISFKVVTNECFKASSRSVHVVTCMHIHRAQQTQRPVFHASARSCPHLHLLSSFKDFDPLFYPVFLPERCPASSIHITLLCAAAVYPVVNPSDAIFSTGCPEGDSATQVDLRCHGQAADACGCLKVPAISKTPYYGCVMSGYSAQDAMPLVTLPGVVTTAPQPVCEAPERSFRYFPTSVQLPLYVLVACCYLSHTCSSTHEILQPLAAGCTVSQETAPTFAVECRCLSIAALDVEVKSTFSMHLISCVDGIEASGAMNVREVVTTQGGHKSTNESISAECSSP
jgi:hypothetical protein